MRPTFIPNVQQLYQMQATKQPRYYNQGMPPAMRHTVQPNQPTQRQNRMSNPTIQTNNLTKPKPERTSRIVIRDPKDNKDVTNKFLPTD
jgi:hypothetical protein